MIGELVTQTIKLKWRYDVNFIDKIEGFRVYRADISDNLFDIIGDEFDEELGRKGRQWVDSDFSGLEERCGKEYYVTAVYIDITTNKKKETPASANSWFSPPCPN